MEPFEHHPTFFTKRMFGGLAIYLFGRQMMLLVEPAKNGRWQWHGEEKEPSKRRRSGR